MGRIDPAGTVVPVDEPGCEGFTVRLLETEGESAGLAEAEAFSGAHDVLPGLVKLTDADGNFVYDYRLSRGETDAVFSLYAVGASADLAEYTATCAGEGCTAAVVDGALQVTCPRGRSCTVAVTDETGTLSDSVYVAHETASIRFVSAIESYCANGIPKTNLYSLAVHYYKHFILGWE